ncbi:hypothetical protein IGI39_004257 [Enterococcus sp. AZ135]|uniref:DUF805 domain-containing protein n=1 Tax=unclassified Enterococcus TaxID=2608891 RepID=UPI003F29A32B
MKKISEQGKVSFSQAVKDFFKGYFDFRGRSTRAGYWWATLGIVLAYIVLAIITIISSQNREYYESPINSFMLVVIILFSLALLVPALALQVRRLRDVGLKSKAILAMYVLYYAAYGTWAMGFYSSAVNSMYTMASMYGGYSSDYTMPMTGISAIDSPMIIFIFMLLSGMLTISAFLPTNMLATKSKNPFLASIFISES